MICASLYRPFFIVNLLSYLAEKILLLNTTNFREDYQPSLPDAARFMSGGFCDLASSDWTVGERHSPFMASPAKTKTPTVIVAIT
jgi:hypothetical protein